MCVTTPVVYHKSRITDWLSSTRLMFKLRPLGHDAAQPAVNTPVGIRAENVNSTHVSSRHYGVGEPADTVLSVEPGDQQQPQSHVHKEGHENVRLPTEREKKQNTPGSVCTAHKTQFKRNTGENEAPEIVYLMKSMCVAAFLVEKTV